MNNYTNPISLIKEEFFEAQTFSQKSLVIFLSLWGLMLSTLAVTGITTIGGEGKVRSVRARLRRPPENESFLRGG